MISSHIEFNRKTDKIGKVVSRGLTDSELPNLLAVLIKLDDAVTNITLQNRDVEMETAYIQILAPTLNAETKWALFTGLSTRPIMPIARKLLLSKNRLCENKELENQLKVSKEDIKQLKLYHMYTVT